MLNTLAQNLTMIRKRKNLLQKDVAKAVGITATALSAYEKGQREPSLSVVFKLAEYYGVSMDRLCGRLSERSSHPARADVLRFISKIYEEMVYYPSVSDTRFDIKTSTRLPTAEDLAQAGFFDEAPDPNPAVYCVDIEFSSVLPWMYDYVDDLIKLLKIQNVNDLDVDIVTPWKKELLNDMKDIPLYTFEWEHGSPNPLNKKEEDNAAQEDRP